MTKETHLSDVASLYNNNSHTEDLSLTKDADALLSENPFEVDENLEKEEELTNNTQVSENLLPEENSDSINNKNNIEDDTTVIILPKNEKTTIQEKIKKFLLKKSNFDFENPFFVRRLLDVSDRVSIESYKIKGWTVFGFEPVLVWDFKNDTIVRALKEDFRLLWTQTSNRRIHRTQDESIENSSVIETIYLFNENDEELGHVSLLKRKESHWIYDLTIDQNQTNENIKVIHKILFANALKEAREQKIFAVADDQNAEEKLRKGARWGIELVASEQKLNFWGFVTKKWLKETLSFGRTKRRKLFKKYSTHI
jgi:hypothetical protein